VAHINVLVVRTSRDVKAEGIAESVAARTDMTLVQSSTEEQSRCVTVEEVDTILESIDPAVRCALVLVGRSSKTNDLAQQWLAKREELVVLHVDLIDDVVRIGLRNPGLDSLLTALRELVEGLGTQKRERVAHIQLLPVKSFPEADVEPLRISTERALLEASVRWAHTLLRSSVEASDEVNGLSVSRNALLESLDELPGQRPNNQRSELSDAEAALDAALATADTNAEPLAVAVRVFGLGPVGFRMMLLALSPELDMRYQRCIGFLLDEITRRVGTIGLYNSLLGITARERGDPINGGALTHWLVLEGATNRPAAADEPLRLDPFLAQWLLGDQMALENDPQVRRSLRPGPWPGASLLRRPEDIAKAAELMDKLQDANTPQWCLLDGEDSPAWRALLELGALTNNVKLIRVDATRLANVDVIEIEESARRIGRLARLTGDPLVVDVSNAGGTKTEAESLRLFFATLDSTGCKPALICRDEARTAQLLGSVPYELEAQPALQLAARVAAMRVAATEAGAYLSSGLAEALVNQFPLHIDDLEHAMHLAHSRPQQYGVDDPSLTRFTTACKELASEGVSHLVDRIEPIFSLDQVVLPPDRKQQLTEIVDNVRLAPRVLDDWKFRDQLPYGRGVSVLFFGSSGTGKTMAAMGVARSLGIQILRLDLSRVVSKYIGDTEKNIDRVFSDAQRSGAAILIDEADALFARRSEIKDSNDRYANLEVAYLLQRMEAYDGLAILTTNLKKNLDPAFMRRLRFIIEFPRPDMEAREKIWRQCLPQESHLLNDADFRQLARRIDLTGGQIRQITLRAAFIAAAAGEQISLAHIARATRGELAKLGLPPIEIDLTRTRRAA
jgi:AAA+ superfamily predicted ATPase